MIRGSCVKGLLLNGCRAESSPGKLAFNLHFILHCCLELHVKTFLTFNRIPLYSKTCLEQVFKNRQNKGLKGRW